MGLIIVLVLLAALLSIYFVFAVVGAIIWLIPWLIVGLIAGWVAGRLVSSPGWGVVGDIGIGLAGSLTGGIFYSLLTGEGAGGPFSLTRILVAIVGAVVLLIAIKAMRGREARGHSP